MYAQPTQDEYICSWFIGMKNVDYTSVIPNTL